jgi:hypothetical protein
MVSLIQHVVYAAGLGTITDLARIKESLIQKLEAGASGSRAKAAKAHAEASAEQLKTVRDAVEIANGLPGANPQLPTEKRVKEVVRQLEDAVSLLRQYGGDLAVDSEELRRIIEVPKSLVTLGAGKVPDVRDAPP